MSPAPPEAELTAGLGESKSLWDAIIAEFSTAQEWKRYSQKDPWSLRVFRGKRTIVWLSPREGWFQAGIILGDKAIQAAREGKPSLRLRKLIDEAPRYAEGTGLRIEVKNARDLALVRKLVEIKIAH